MMIPQIMYNKDVKNKKLPKKNCRTGNAIGKLKFSRGVQQQTRSSRNKDWGTQSSLKSHWVREAKKEWKKVIVEFMGHPHQNDQYICYGSSRRREMERTETESKK